jgi:cytochrome oxidase Cu insertion factor (SCO1/SenC/PrrC family)
MVLGGLPAFTLTDQRGQPFGSRELAGKIWVADFMFTSCQGVCPLLTQRMAEVGKRARHLGPGLSPRVDLGRSRTRHARAAG